MKTQAIVFSLLLLLFAGSPVFAGEKEVIRMEYSNRRYDLRDGMPNLLLETLYQDKQGFIWLGTYKGFCRFDGFTFTSFLSETAINILYFDTDPEGHVRAYTYHDAFVVYANDSIRSVRLVPEDIFLNTFNSRNLPEGYLIFENADASHKFLMHWQEDSLITVLESPELDQIGESKPYLDIANNMMYMPSLKGLNIYDIQKQQTTFIPQLAIEAFVKHSTLGLLGLNSDGIYQLNGNQCKKIFSCKFASHKQAVEASDGSLIIKDFFSIYRFRNQQLETLVPDCKGGNWDMLYDREGNLWIASQNGLYNYLQFDFKNYSIENDVVKNILEYPVGTYWFGTYYGKLIRETKGKAEFMHYPMTKSSSFLFGAAAIDGRLYFPRDNDLLIYDQKRFSWAGFPPDTEGYCRVLPSANNEILVLTPKGVHQCDKYGKSLRFFSEDFFKQPDLQDLLIDSKGHWYISGSFGISIVSGDSVRLIKNKNTNFTVPICLDKQNRIWSGSENRLNLLANDSIITVHQFKGDFIQSLLAIDPDHLLIATIQGIYIMDLQLYASSGKTGFLFYNHRNGLTAQEAQAHGLYRDSQGTLWVPFTDCLVAFDPRKLIRENAPPLFHILNSEASTDNVHWYKADLEKGALSYKQRNIRFSFIGLKYSATESVRYTFRLVGFQNEWSQPSSNKEVTFNNLPPGDYIFEARANAGSDDSRSEVQTIRFSIRPAFWQTWWFLAVSVLSLMFISTGLALYIQQKKNKRLLQQLETEKELNELRIRSIRLRSIPHFNANVLSAIEYYIMNFSKEEANRLLNIYSEFIGRTLREVDKASRNLQDELEYTQLFLQLEKLRYVDKFEYTIEIDPKVNPQQIQLPNMVLHTYCENAIKHGFSGRTSECKLHISARQKEERVEIRVEDNGIGRKAAADRNTRSTKQGLEILNRQIDIYNSLNKTKIIRNTVDLYDGDTPCGTCFIIEIPYNYVYR